jgi:periplasmic protein TonB
MKSTLFSLLLFFFVLGFNSLAQNKQPEPIGGVEAILKNVVYPQSAIEANIQGKVLIKAIIDEKGNVVETEVINSIQKDCDQAAVDAIKKTKFTSGIKENKPVKAEVVIPIMFKLD